jgi:hypothetical protein
VLRDGRFVRQRAGGKAEKCIGHCDLLFCRQRLAARGLSHPELRPLAGDYSHRFRMGYGAVFIQRTEILKVEQGAAFRIAKEAYAIPEAGPFCVK